MAFNQRRLKFARGKIREAVLCIVIYGAKVSVVLIQNTPIGISFTNIQSNEHTRILIYSKLY